MLSPHALPLPPHHHSGPWGPGSLGSSSVPLTELFTFIYSAFLAFYKSFELI